MSNHVVEKHIEILLVEDSLGDIRLIEEVFKRGRTKNNLSVVRDGVEAMTLLRREGEYAYAKRPELILLDLNLPKKDGREVLEEIKADECLRRTPVIVLTTSESEEDVLKCYNLHANAYITKPTGLKELVEAIHAFENFWLMTVKLPPVGSK